MDDWSKKAGKWLDNKLDGALSGALDSSLAGMPESGSNYQEKISFTVDGLPLDAYTLELEEGLSLVPGYRLYCAVGRGMDGQALLGKLARLRLTSRDGLFRDVAGEVCSIHQGHYLPDGKQEWVFDLHSGLRRLANQRRYRIVHRRTVVELVEELLADHGLEVEKRLDEDYPVRDWTAQVGETDLDFLQRLLAMAGIWYVTQATDTGETIVLADGQQGALRAVRGELSIRPEIGGVRSLVNNDAVVLDQRLASVRNMPGQIRVHQQLSPSGGNPLVSALGEPDQATQTLFRAGIQGSVESQRQARLIHEGWQTQRYQISVRGPVGDVAPGQWIPLEGEGPCLVIRARATLSLPREHQGNTPQPLHWEAELIPLSRPFRPPWPERPDLPMVFPATIESTEPYAQLDGQGRSQARVAFDQSEQLHGEASPPLRQLQPFGGLPGRDGHNTGWQWPLRDGARVLIACQNEDPDQPLILGYIPTSDQPGPVTSKNRSQYKVLTPAGNVFCLDDMKKAESITLHTPGGHCLLKLDANSESPLIKLACGYGGLVLRAKGNQDIQVGKNSRTVIGESQSTQVGLAIQYVTENGVIHFQAATDTHLRAKGEARIQSGEDTQIRSGKHLGLRAERNVKMIAGKSLMGSIGGSAHLQSDKAINIRGDGTGDITIHQGGGGITIKADGTVRIFGNSVSIINKG